MKIFIMSLLFLFLFAGSVHSDHLHKQVDGVRVPLSVLEEARVLAEWAANEAKSNAQRIEKADKKALRKTQDTSLRIKLKALGLTDEEIVLLLGEIE